MEKRHILFLLFTLLFSVNLVQAQDNFNFLNFYLDENSQTNKVSYEIRNSQEYEQGDKFVLETYFNNELKDEKCIKELDVSNSILFTKLVCDVKKYGDGEYTFVGKIMRGNEEINSQLTKHYLFANTQAKITGEILEDKTIIYIDVSGTDEKLIIKNRIPKEAIELLTNENKDQLITSDFKYEILEEDPLIAWSVEKAPEKINYTINKKLNQEDISKFQVQLEKEENYLKYSNYFLIIVIAVIIFLVFRPILRRKIK